ncbi:MAG: ornithine carbamoyltransferase [Thermofilaceae archaeon]
MEEAKHLLDVYQLTSKELVELLETAIMYKKLRKKGIRCTRELRGRSVAMIFEKPSTRTRASFAVAVYEMGGLPVAYNREELQLARGEPVKDLVRVLSRYHDAIAARVYHQENLEEMAKYSSVPVINLLSDKFHPLQALADCMTIIEIFGKLKGIKLAFVGDGQDNVFNSLAIAGLKLGMEIRIACPPEYGPKVSWLKKLAGEIEGTLEVYDEPLNAVKDVDVVYTDVFVSMGQEKEKDERLRSFLPRYRVSLELMKHAGTGAVFMHCLPAHRGEEVDETVIESERSVIFEQAENRLHTAKAVLKKLLCQESPISF